MEILLSLLHRNWSVNLFNQITRLSVNLFNNWSVNLFKPIYSLSKRARLSPLHVTVCCKPRDRLRQKATPKALSLFCQSEIAPNGRCDLGSLNSVVAVFSGRVAIVLNFCNLQF